MTYLHKYSNSSKNRTVQTYLKSVKSYFRTVLLPYYTVITKQHITITIKTCTIHAHNKTNILYSIQHQTLHSLTCTIPYPTWHNNYITIPDDASPYSTITISITTLPNPTSQ